MALPSWTEIEMMDTTEVAAQFDEGRENVVAGKAFWADVLVYKASMQVAHAQTAQNARMVDLTRSIENVTKGLWVIGIATFVASLAAVFIALGS